MDFCSHSKRECGMSKYLSCCQLLTSAGVRANGLALWLGEEVSPSDPFIAAGVQKAALFKGGPLG